jgi:hypothetical protein
LYLREFLATDPAFRPLLELSLDVGVLEGRRLFLNFREILKTKP